MKIKVIGTHGCGVDYGCLNSFSWFEQYECSLQDFGKTLYQILQSHPFPEYRIEYNIDTSAQLLRNKDEDIVRPILNNEGIELENKEPLG